MKFRSRDGEMKRLALLDGRVWLIGTEWKEIPDDVHQDAYAIGCVSEDMVRSAQDMTLPPAAPVAVDPAPVAVDPAPVAPAPVAPVADRNVAVLAHMREMVASGATGTMTAKGLPNKKFLFEKCGFTPSTKEFDKAWAVIISEE